MDLPKIKTVVWDPSGDQDRRVILLKVEEEGASRDSAYKPPLIHTLEAS